MNIPSPGDLVSINKDVSAVLIGGDFVSNSNWGYTLITVTPGHNGLVLEVYNPKSLEDKNVNKAADELLLDQKQRLGQNSTDSVTIIVLTIGTNIVETVYDPQYMSIINI